MFPMCSRYSMFLAKSIILLIISFFPHPACNKKIKLNQRDIFEALRHPTSEHQCPAR